MMVATRGRRRIERDTLGEKSVPAEALYGAQTARAVENFAISGQRPHPALVWALAAIKCAAAQANVELGCLDGEVGGAIIRAAREVCEGKWADQFVVDVYQAGAGTSLHMNVNEVLANRALELLGAERGEYRRVHPNDHVNFGQSTNDVFPTAMRLAALREGEPTLEALEGLATALEGKGAELASVLKAGRTHLQDALPVTLGQEFASYAAAVRRGVGFLREALLGLEEMGIGGTAVGTGINAHPDYPERVVEHLRHLTGLALRTHPDRFEAMNSMAPFGHLSGVLRGIALELLRISNDLRLLSSGPRAGLAEIRLPAVQPGSSIMPGKVNPVMAEALAMVCFQVVGDDLAVAMATQAGQLELNVMMPVIAHNILQPLGLLARAVRLFTDRCVVGIQAEEERCRDYFERSAALAALLNPLLGYERAAAIAQRAVREGRTIREVLLEEGSVDRETVDRLLAAESVTQPGLPGGARAPEKASGGGGA